MAKGIPKRLTVAFSAVLTEERYADGDLHNSNLKLINERVQRRHQRAALPLVFAGVDISYNEDSTGKWQGHWQLQVYGVCVGVDMAELRQRLEKLYPTNNTAPKPLRVRRCKTLPKALSYIIKPYFGRRVSYLDKTGRSNTRKVPLKRLQAQEVATWINNYPLTARYALTGCRCGSLVRCQRDNSGARSKLMSCNTAFPVGKYSEERIGYRSKQARSANLT
jgi:hypothetical protein